MLGTHGRSIIILDDIGPLARYGATTADAAALYETRPGTIMNYWKDTSYRAQSVFMGDNPVDGTLVTYRLGPGSGPARLTVRNAAGDVVRELGRRDCTGSIGTSATPSRTPTAPSGPRTTPQWSPAPWTSADPSCRRASTRCNSRRAAPPSRET